MAGILIVEEDEAIRVLAQSILEEHNHSIFSANTTDQAAALLESGRNIQLLFTETELQGEIQSGLEFAREAVKRRPELAVLYTSTRSVTDGMKELFVEKSAFLPKPYTVDQLLTTLVAHFGLRDRAPA